MQRTYSAELLNRVANDPAVRPGVGGGDGPLDLGSLVTNPANVALVNEHGGFVYIQQEPGLYEVHSLLLPEGRGAAALTAARASLRFMFTATDCFEVVTRCPAGNKGAKGLTIAVGFWRSFESRGDSFWTLPFDRWRASDPDLMAAGERFHAMLEAAKSAAGSHLPIHDDDAAHDRAVGAAVLMAEAGQAAKAVWTYNRWARFAGYASIDLISTDVIDVRDALVSVAGGRMEVLECR